MIRRLRAFLSGLSGAAAQPPAEPPRGPRELPANTPEILRTPEDRFWRWFLHNRPLIERYAVETDAVVDAVQSQINLISSHLSFELGQAADGTFEFIISAGGVKRLIPRVTRLYNAAPAIPGWRVMAFKPRHSTPQIEYGGEKFSISDFYYASQVGEDGKTNLRVCIRGYNRRREKMYGMVGFLFLDTVIGEYDVMTNLGAIEFGDIPPGPMTLSGLKPLRDLAPEIDAIKSRLH
ncbi:MAG: hypothetical protein KJ017_11015 [Alphaproteobacteria bacterium]|nr:hypothetical protein [Alphaproteobacteria bacterium]